jgi:superfamily II DNA or RNA helicase
MSRIHHSEYAGALREIRRTRVENVDPSSELKHPFKTLLIVDESHTIRTTSSQTFHAVFSIASEVDKVLLLTGTPMVNSVEDMQAQLRILKDSLHETIPAAYYVNQKTLDVMHSRDFMNHFSQRVLTHLIPLNSEEYPASDHTIHQVPMYDLQRQRYEDFDLEMMTPALRTLMKEGVISTALNSFLTRTRAISNTVGRYALAGEKDEPELSAKFRGIRKSLVEDPKPAVVYSFYLDNGVIPLKEFVDSTTDLRTAIITGTTKPADVKRIIREYNIDQTIDVLFLTSAVRQGISLLRTRTLHEMEAGWNESLREQIEGRVIRYRSHMDLPPNQRHVQIHLWLTTLGSDKPSTDQYIHSVAQRKMEVIEKFEELLTRLPLPKSCNKRRVAAQSVLSTAVAVEAK